MSDRVEVWSRFKDQESAREVLKFFVWPLLILTGFIRICLTAIKKEGDN